MSTTSKPPITGPSGDPQKWIQGLNDLLDEKDRRIEQLERERDEARKLLEAKVAPPMCCFCGAEVRP